MIDSTSATGVRASAGAGGCRVLELRQYTLHPGQRDVLIELFDREFLESQEDLGMTVVGQFRDLDDPDRFVWLRGFTDMDSRRAGLTGFYGGPVWAAHKGAANVTMIDSDDVLLLRPVVLEPAFRPPAPRPPVGATELPGSIVTATVHPLAGPATGEILELFGTRMERILAQAGSSRVAALQTESSGNTFPALPVREGEHVLVRLARFDDVDAYAACRDRLSRSAGWSEVCAELRPHLVAAAQELRLAPPARSRLR